MPVQNTNVGSEFHRSLTCHSPAHVVRNDGSVFKDGKRVLAVVSSTWCEKLMIIIMARKTMPWVQSRTQALGASATQPR